MKQMRLYDPKESLDFEMYFTETFERKTLFEQSFNVFQ